MNGNQVTYLADKMGIDPEDLNHRKDYFGLNDKDIQALKFFNDNNSLVSETFISGFYSRLRSYPEIAEILTEEVIDKLLVSQSIYFNELTSGQYDSKYVLNRLRLGLIHHDKGIKPIWFLSAYADYLNGILDLAFKNESKESILYLDAIRVLFRIVLFDISLGLEAYFFADKQSLSQLKVFNEHVFSNTPIGMVLVDEELVILKANNSFLELFKIDEISENSPLSLFFDTEQITEAIKLVNNNKSRHEAVRINTNINGVIHYLEVDVSPQYIDEDFVAIVTLHDQTAAEKLTNDLRTSQLQLNQIVNSIADAIITIDQEGLITSSNESVKQLFGYDVDELLGNYIEQIIPNINDVEEVKKHYKLNRQSDEFIKSKNVILLEGHTKEGSIFPVEVSFSEIYTDSGHRLIVVVKDISEIYKSREKHKELSRVIEQTADSVMVTDENSLITYVNPAFEEITGHTFNDIAGRKPTILKSGKHDQEFYQRLWETINRGDAFRDVFINCKSNGDIYYEEKTITPLKDEKGKIIRFVSTGKDVTERIHAEEHLFHLANHDVLTDLPNRSLLSERIKQAISRARWNDRLVALLFLDLDQFKIINDTLGHDIGDELLVEVAKRLLECTRDGDTVSRLGGDEFSMLLVDIASTDDVDPIAQKILASLSAPYDIQNRELFISASIGISCFPTDGNEAKILLRNSDVAMYRAKDNGRNNYEYFSDEMTTRAFKRLNMESRLRSALQNDEYQLYYQPQTDRESRKIIGVEALLRWQSPDMGLISPDEFVPILEDTGLIIPVGQWIIKTACLMMKELDDLNVYLPSMSINLSARQITDEEIIPVIKQCLRDFELASDRLTIEITETLLMENKQQSTSLLRQFRDLGLNIALDDFGTGYSSLSYLTKFPIDTVKIDKLFINDVPGDEQNSALTSAIISMTHDLGMKVVAEGVENEEQVKFLHERKCDVYQGFYFSKPIKGNEIKRLLAEQQNVSVE